MGSSTSHTTRPSDPASPIYVVVENPVTDPVYIVIGNPDGEQATIFTDQKSGKKALLTSFLEFLNTFSRVYTSNQTNLAIITPASGNKLCVHGVITATESNTGDVSLDFATSNIPASRLYATRDTQQVAIDLHIEGAVNEPLTLTTTTGDNDVFIAISYIEEG